LSSFVNHQIFAVTEVIGWLFHTETEEMSFHTLIYIARIVYSRTVLNSAICSCPSELDMPAVHGRHAVLRTRTYRVFHLSLHRARQLYRIESLHLPVHRETTAVLRTAIKAPHCSISVFAKQQTMQLSCFIWKS
jgi:hypothetical protein